MLTRNRNAYVLAAALSVVGTWATVRPVFAADHIFDGSTSLDIGVATNYADDVLPSPVNGDNIVLNGTVASNPLALTYSTGLNGVAGNIGVGLVLAAGQTAPVSLDNGTSTTALRLGGVATGTVQTAISIASGAGALTLGDGLNTATPLTITLGATGGTTQIFLNNSTNAATLNADVLLNNGGGGAHTVQFDGSGNWVTNNAQTNGSSGTIAFAKVGAGTLTLNGANSYTGGTLITAGTVIVGTNGTLGNTTNTTTINGGTLDFAGSAKTIGALAGTGGTVVSNSSAATTLSIGSGNTGNTYAGVIADSSTGTAGQLSLNKTGSGTQILVGANTYTGTTTIGGGTLQIGNGGTTGSLSPTSAIVNNGALLLARSVTLVQGVDFGTVSGTGTINIGFANSNTSAVRISSGTGLSSGLISIFGNGATAANSGGRLELTNNLTLANAVSLSGKIVGGAGAVGIESVSGNNTISGPVTLTTGGNFYTLQSDAGLLTLNNATPITINAAATSRVLTLQGDGNGAISTAITSAATTTAAPGAGALAKAGTGTWTLSATNTYAGGTTVSGGTLAITADGGLGSGNVVVNGGTLAVSGGTLNNYIADTATLALTSGAFDALNYTGTDVVNGLSINGLSLPAGIYGAIGSSAPAANQYAVFTGIGTITSLGALVPEPTSLAVLGLGAVGLLRRRRA